MKFSTREDIEAPVDHVSGYLVDFDSHEKLILERNGKIQRVDDAPCPSVGNQWDIELKVRGKDRKLKCKIVKVEENKVLNAKTSSDGLDANMEISLVPLSKSKTRMLISVDLKPKSLSVRLVVQSMKLAKSSLMKRFKDRVGQFAQVIENDYKNA